MKITMVKTIHTQPVSVNEADKKRTAMEKRNWPKAVLHNNHDLNATLHDSHDSKATLHENYDLKSTLHDNYNNNFDNVSIS